jgi:hypothetical protein
VEKNRVRNNKVDGGCVGLRQNVVLLTLHDIAYENKKMGKEKL